MNIDPTSPIRGVERAAIQPHTFAKQSPRSDEVNFAGHASLSQAMGQTPDVRPDMVARARELIASPDYPSSEVMTKVSQILADGLSG